MSIKNTRHIILIVTLLLSSCCLPPMLDFAGRGCPDNCIFLDTESMTVVYNCNKEKISGIRIFFNDGDPNERRNLACDEYIDQPVHEHGLSFTRDFMRNKSVDIWVSITNTHWREHSVISITPRNIDNKRIKARYFSH